MSQKQKKEAVAAKKTAATAKETAPQKGRAKKAAKPRAQPTDNYVLELTKTVGSVKASTHKAQLEIFSRLNGTEDRIANKVQDLRSYIKNLMFICTALIIAFVYFLNPMV